MTGSDKQIGWAETIQAARKAAVASGYNNIVRRIEDDKADYGDCPKEQIWMAAAEQVKAQIIESLDATTSAESVIDSRADNYGNLFSSAWMEAVEDLTAIAAGQSVKDRSYTIVHGITRKLIHIAGTYIQRHIAKTEASK